MRAVDRRRFARIPVFHEEAAVVHAQGGDIPIKIVDLSRTGLLFSFAERRVYGESPRRRSFAGKVTFLQIGTNHAANAQPCTKAAKSAAAKGSFVCL